MRWQPILHKNTIKTLRKLPLKTKRGKQCLNTCRNKWNREILIKSIKNKRNFYTAAVTINEGIPFLIPYFLLCNSNIPLTTTAGETAARMNPIEIANKKSLKVSKFELKINIPVMPTIQASENPGKAVSLTPLRK